MRSIGVSNFEGDYIDQLIAETGMTLAINQIQLHPLFQQATMRAKHAKLGVVAESWSLRGQGQLLDRSVFGTIAAWHDKSTAEVIIRWHIELGLVVIPLPSAAPIWRPLPGSTGLMAVLVRTR